MPLDLAGKQIGRLTVLSKAAKKNNCLAWVCKCSCGNELIVSSSNLKRQKSCGCLRDEIEVLIGQRFGKLVVLSFVETDSKRKN